MSEKQFQKIIKVCQNIAKTSHTNSTTQLVKETMCRQAQEFLLASKKSYNSSVGFVYKFMGKEEI